MYEDFRNWYIGYCQDTFLSGEDESFEDFDYAHESGMKLNVLYSSFDDSMGNEHGVEVSITLNPAEERVYIDNKQVHLHKFGSLDELYESFKGTTFDKIFDWAITYHTEEASA